MESEASKPAVTGETPEKARILVMDDEQGILDLLTYELGSHGYSVDKAHNGLEGIEKIKKEKYNIVISDVKMPKLGGLDALVAIKEIDPNVEVIMTTGFGTIDMAVECMKKGAYDFVSKPYNLDELCSRINKALEKQNLTSELISLKELHRLKSEFLANTSHELRTPMNAIVGYTNLLLDGIYGQLTEKQATALRRIDVGANNLLQLINNILDVSKLSAGKINLFLEDFSFNELLSDVTGMMDALAREKNISLKLVTLDKPKSVISDKTRIKQILINLIGNAIKFTNTGTVTVSARILGPQSSKNDFESVLIEVKDTGIGIKPEYMNIIFEEFRQGDASTTREYGGTGLGLTIAKKLTELMGGKITVTSKIDEGSVFTVILPLKARLPKTTIESMASLAPARQQPVDDGKKIVLVIDDSPEAHKLLKDSLTGSEFRMVGALSGDEGIALAKQLKPFAITLDILMPYRDGWSVLQELKSDPATSAIPVVIISVIDNKTLGFSLGVADYLLKPFERKTLIERLDKLRIAKNQKILIVDNDIELNTVMKMLLTNAGYNVSSVLSGQEALDTLAKDKPDIMLLDLMMPGVSGFDVLEAIHKNPALSAIRVIIMTAKSLTKNELEELNKHAEGILEKGTKNIREILSDIKRQLGMPDA